ncbi:SOS response-associated peptidase [Variovorax ginsengisoli]|uniref:Abasic site processing protein n=1 Tax=Variovorax ginsengisoli TaxID=363844 RepID=A0ABT8S7A0_9BURK|nr:SOS response-associated peptidase family protein [Variovorax ginsengisoli]MDN8615623.1 SOS response-associated peptidase family protein [Variovorax ginsengisoli]MDO1534793.1 SOS response-associated peptidase family protein [Variovorax ginsengisoli]
MCSHYQAEKRRKQIAKHFGIQLPPSWEPPPGGLHIYPTQMAPFIRRPPERESGDEAIPDFEVVEGHFGLLPGFAKDAKFGLKTYNARSETVRELASFKNAWARPRHCIVPCEAIYEPDWRTGKFIPTRFTAANDETLGVAGLWSPWKNPETAEWELSFTMLTINADAHPLFKLMHRPDLKRPPEKQDKRMVAILPEAWYGEWLDAPPERSMDFLMQFPAERLAMVAEAPPLKEPKAPKVKTTPSESGPVEPPLF